MLTPRPLQLLAVAAIFSSLTWAVSCGGSKANVRKDETNSSAQPAAVDVATAPAIMRELPQFFEATGSLTGDQQTDVAPSAAGKVTAGCGGYGGDVEQGGGECRAPALDAQQKRRK